MAMTNEEMALARQALATLVGAGFGVGRAARPGGRVWNTITREAPEGYTPDHQYSAIQAATDIADRMQSEPIEFDAGIVYVPGDAQHNAMLERTPENLASFLRQSEAEHRAALEKYLNDPKYAGNPERALRLGIREEERLPKWWNDHDPRLPVTPSSSAVSSARIGPNGDIYIRFQEGGKEYQYEGSADPVEASRILQELVTSDSIGRAVNSWTGSWGRAHTYLPKG